MDLDVLLNKISSYNQNIEELKAIQKAYHYAASLHMGQKRQSGEEYIIHPLAVAMILAEYQADTNTIMAALLHDTIEDTGITKEILSREFNEHVARLVDGVTDLSKMNFANKDAELAGNIRKLMNCIAQDIRIILIKLADRLHNMRTLEYMEQKKQINKSFETRYIYAPIANRLGCNRIKTELENLSFKYIDPESYYKLEKDVNKIISEFDDYLEIMLKLINDSLNSNMIPNNVKKRIKSLYQIYYKIENEKVNLNNMHDLLGIVVEVSAIKDCYASLGVVHGLFKTTNKDMRDYIYQPKVNMYQSIHTSVFGSEGRRVQIRIRTHEMDKIASRGIAAYWQHKTINMNSIFRTNQLFESLTQLELSSNSDAEYYDALKQELGSNMYVFTPKGKIIQLPQGSTTIDFAYKIHTDIGNKMIAAKINNEDVTPETIINHKDIVEIITGDSTPDPEWIKICKTPLAKRKILSFYDKTNNIC